MMVMQSSVTATLSFIHDDLCDWSPPSSLSALPFLVSPLRKNDLANPPGQIRFDQ
jgi:hypothetical protein